MTRHIVSEGQVSKPDWRLRPWDQEHYAIGRYAAPAARS
jgi:hypothetical protein